MGPEEQIGEAGSRDEVHRDTARGVGGYGDPAGSLVQGRAEANGAGRRDTKGTAGWILEVFGIDPGNIKTPSSVLRGCRKGIVIRTQQVQFTRMEQSGWPIGMEQGEMSGCFHNS